MNSSLFPSLLEARLRAAFDRSSVASDLPEDFSTPVMPAADTRFGDYQSNAAMVLAKRLKRNPRELATEIVGLIDLEGLAKPAEVAGPGFINFWISEKSLATTVETLLGDDARLGVPPADEPHTIVIDFSAPNVAKPMHVGHIRSTIIGDSLARIARFLGHSVITDNHIGDWGTQFGMVLYGWKNFLDEAALEADPVKELLRLYRHVNGLAKADEALLDACKQELVKLQGGDAENLSIWTRCVEVSKQGLQRIYDLLDVKFDHWLGESFYNDKLAPLVDGLIASGIAEESDGAICIFFREDGRLADKPALIRKSDGGFLYATTDLATIEYRVNELKADEVWYVVGAPQQLHFDQIFAAAQKQGVTATLAFIPFGSILGKDKKMLRTRSGDTVQLADVLDEAIERAGKVIEEKNAERDTAFSAEETAEIARIIGIGSVKYAELSQHRMTDYIFDWDTMLALKGNTAPYLINAYVRTRSIFRKRGEGFGGAERILVEAPQERSLALKLAQFAEIVPQVLSDFRPNLLANYLYELANTFHAFYENCPVLKSEGDVQASRLALCEATSRVLRKGLELLGIQVAEQM